MVRKRVKNLLDEQKKVPELQSVSKATRLQTRLRISKQEVEEKVAEKHNTTAVSRNENMLEKNTEKFAHKLRSQIRIQMKKIGDNPIENTHVTRSQAKKNSEERVVENLLTKTMDKTYANHTKDGKDAGKNVPEKKFHVIKAHQFYTLSDFKLNSLVLAKQKYSIPWPARILKLKKDSVSVYFFGDKRVGDVPRTEIYEFSKSFKAVQAQLLAKRQPRGYVAGIREVEMLMNIPIEESATNLIQFRAL